MASTASAASARSAGSASPARPGQDRVASVIASTAAALSAPRVGGLIVIERETPLGDMAEQGVALDAHLSTELLTSLFAPGTALHDGAVIVRGETVLAAAVTLPLSEDVPVHGRYGTRHRAALGITEQTDAVAVVVSEERGTISLAAGGTMTSDIDPERLRSRLVELLGPQAGMSDRARRMAERGGRSAPRQAVARAASRQAPGERVHGAGDGRRLGVSRRHRGRVGERPRDDDRRTAAGHRGRRTRLHAIERAGPSRPRRSRRRRPERRRVTLLRRVLLGNWPVKLAAVGLAVVLYAGVALSENTRTWDGPVPIEVLRSPAGGALLEQPGSVTTIRYRAPIEATGQLTGGSFRASIDLSARRAARGRRSGQRGRWT